MVQFFLMCEYTQTDALTKKLKRQFRGQEGKAEVLTHGMTSKQGIGFVLLEFVPSPPEDFEQQVQANNEEIIDYAAFDFTDQIIDADD